MKSVKIPYLGLVERTSLFYENLNSGIVKDLMCLSGDWEITGSKQTKHIAICESDHGKIIMKPCIRDAKWIQKSWFYDNEFTTAHRESIFWVAARDVFNLSEFIPETTTFKTENTVWSAMRWVDGDPYNQVCQLEKYGHSDVLFRLAIMDIILGNSDRNPTNIVISDKGKLRLIDNSMSFDYEGVVKKRVPAYAIHLTNRSVPTSVLSWIRCLDSENLEGLLRMAGVPIECVSIAAARLNEAKKWCNEVTKNKSASMNLGWLLEILEIHEGLPTESFFKKRKAFYSNINRGISFIYTGIDSLGGYIRTLLSTTISGGGTAIASIESAE